MRKSKQIAQEIEAVEMATDKQKRIRQTGYNLMPVRDRGWVRLNNGVGMSWHVDRPLKEYEARQVVPSGHFVLHFGNDQHILFDADEFGKWSRWA